MLYDLIVLGDLVADLIVPVERLPLMPLQHGWAEGIFVEPGGAGNVLVSARRMGLFTATLGLVGSDYYGTRMLEMLAQEGVDVEHVAVYSGRATIICMVLADVQGQHVYLGIKDQLGRWTFPADWHSTIPRARALFTDGYTIRDLLEPADTLAALATARAAGVPIYFDPGPSIEFVPAAFMRQVIAATDTLLLTEEEAVMLCGVEERTALLAALLNLGPHTVVMKQGAAGCTVATANEIVQSPGFPVKVVDTVGAGDAFAAAFIAGQLRGGSLVQAARLANAMGALTTTQRGAGTRIPPREALLQMLADSPDLLALA